MAFSTDWSAAWKAWNRQDLEAIFDRPVDEGDLVIPERQGSRQARPSTRPSMLGLIVELGRRTFRQQSGDDCQQSPTRRRPPAVSILADFDLSAIEPRSPVD